MATGPIIFTIQDGVDPNIATKIASIGSAASTSDASVQALTQSLQAIQSTGLSGLSNQLAAVSTSTARLSTATSKMSAVALDASQKIDILTQSYTRLDAAIAAALVTITAFGSAAKAAQGSAVSFNQGVNNLGAGAGRTTGNFIASSAALQTLEGHFGSNTRAAGRFLTTSLGLGPVLQAAFPIFGAVALLGVLDIAITTIDKVALHLHNLTIEAQQQALAILNSQQILIKGDKGLQLGNKFLGRPNVKDQIIDDPKIVIREINYQVQLNDLAAQNNEFGKTGLALQKAKVDAVNKEIEITKNAISIIQSQRSRIDDPKTKTGLLDETVQRTDAFSRELKKKGLGVPTSPTIPVDSPQFKELANAAKEYDGELDRLNKQLNILQEFKLPQAQLREPLAAAKDEAKAARAQLKLFADQLAQLKIQDHVVTPEEKLGLLSKQKELAERTHPSNVPAIDSQIGTQVQIIERQKQALENVNEKLQDQAANIGLYSDKLKEANEFDKISLELKKNGVILTNQQTSSIKDRIHQIVSEGTYQKELNKIYNESNQPLRDYEAKTQAIDELLSKGDINRNQALIAQNEANKAFRDAINPLTEYAHGLQNEIALFGQYGVAATVAAEIQKVQNELRNKGRELSEQENIQLKAFLTNLERQKQIQTAVNQLYVQNIGQVEKLTVEMTALNIARQKGIISEQQYDTQLSKLTVDLANLNIAMGKFTKSDVLTSVFGSFLKDFKGLTVGIIDTWQKAFDTIASGAANALGRAIAYGENLGTALKDVARQALSELIAGFIKLGIQLLITKIIGATAGAAALTATITEAAAASAAWAPAAAFASLATLGSNAGPADVALTTTVALANALSILKFASGGIVPGLGNKDTVPALLTPGEAVLTQQATRTIGPSTIQAWNKGQFAQNTASVSSSGTSSKQSLTLNLIHDKNAVDVVRINEDTIRVIAKDEGRKAVEQHAPNVIAGEIGNPNSGVSKQMTRQTYAGRRR